MRIVNFIKMASVAGALSTALFCASAVTAQALSDEFRILDGGGVVRYDLKILENSRESIGPHFVKIKGITNLFDPTQYGHFIALFDQGTPMRISDVVGIYAAKTPTGTVLHLAFASDTETKSPRLTNWIAPGVAPPPPIPETGIINVTQFLNAALRANNWTATFFSDSDAGNDPPAPVPEPAAWIMMLTGLAGIGAASRLARRRRKAVA
jgi:hypothetical protein